MGSVRVCDGRCHGAEHSACDCWCGGLFHGKGAEDAREAFRNEFGADIPSTEEAIGQVISQGDLFRGGAERFSRAIAAARARGRRDA